MKAGDKLEFSDVVDAIGVALTVYTGQGIASVYNRLSCNQIKFVGNNTWIVRNVSKPSDHPDIEPDPVLHKYKPAKRQ